MVGMWDLCEDILAPFAPQLQCVNIHAVTDTLFVPKARRATTIVDDACVTNCPAPKRRSSECQSSEIVHQLQALFYENRKILFQFTQWY